MSFKMDLIYLKRTKKKAFISIYLAFIWHKNNKCTYLTTCSVGVTKIIKVTQCYIAKILY